MCLFFAFTLMSVHCTSPLMLINILIVLLKNEKKKKLYEKSNLLIKT